MFPCSLHRFDYLMPDLRHRSRIRRVDRCGLLRKHGRGLQHVDVLAANAREELRVGPELVGVLGLQLLQLGVEPPEHGAALLVRPLPADELQYLEPRRLDVFGLHRQDPVGGVLRLLPVLHAQLQLHLLR